MRRGMLAASLVAVAPIIALACGDSSPAADTAEAGVDAAADISFPDTNDVPTEAGVVSCKLPNGTDPVLLCFQKALLLAQMDAVFADGVGIYASWDSKSFEPDKDDGGQFVRDFHDDVAFAAAIANYQTSALVYGDSENRATFNALLSKLEALIEKDMSPLPAEYGGDLYRQLRIVADGLRVGGAPTLSDSIDRIADAYGRAILTYATPVAAIADAGDAGISNAAVLGTPTAGGVAYSPTDVTTGAFALLDMAHRHANDDPTFATNAQAAAIHALDYVWARGRDATTGMFFAALVTSSDPDHDALAPATSGPSSDALLLEVQSSIAIALARAQELVSMPSNGLGMAATSYPFDLHASAIVDAVNGGTTSLWDGLDAPDAGAGAGYIEGYVPSTMTRLTTKPSRGNAIMYATLHRLLVDVGGNYPWQGKYLRPIVIAPAPPLNAGLYSVVTSQSGYFRATSQSFELASEPRAASYTSRAVQSICETLNELWYGFHM